jgi:hypothetical protein
MKIRQGFVSNSSTSSFCLFGIILHEDVSKYLPTDFEDKHDEDYEEYFDNLGLSYRSETEYGAILGVDPDSMKDDETGAQYKARILSMIKTALPFYDESKARFEHYCGEEYN